MTAPQILTTLALSNEQIRKLLPSVVVMYSNLTTP